MSVSQTRDLLSLAKPGVTGHVLLTTWGGLWLAGGTDLRTTIACLVGTALIVAAANALNCYVERDSDGRMSRTRDRPLPAGRLSPRVALAAGLSWAAVAIPLLVWGVNPVCGLLGAIALIAYALVYTPMKRYSAWALPIGAIPGAVPPLLGWTAATGRVDLGGLALFAVLFVWQHPHFLAISVMREEDYRAAGLHTVAGAVGAATTTRLAILSVLLLVPLSLAPTSLGLTGPLYAVLALLAGAVWSTRALASWREAEVPWRARRLFTDSLLYLTVLFVALPLDAWIATS